MRGPDGRFGVRVAWAVGLNFGDLCLIARVFYHHSSSSSWSCCWSGGGGKFRQVRTWGSDWFAQPVGSALSGRLGRCDRVGRLRGVGAGGSCSGGRAAGRGPVGGPISSRLSSRAELLMAAEYSRVKDAK